MPKKIHGLGRGLDALLPENDALEAGLQTLPIGQIDPNPDQPRRTFTEDGLADLARSVSEQGVLQPVLVTPGSDGRYRIVAGERRWRAARLAGLKDIPCIIRDLDGVQQMEIALIENLQREDLNPIEEAAGIDSLIRRCGYTQEQAAARLGKSRPAIANALRLLNLPADIRELVVNGRLSAGHARVLAGIADETLQRALAKDTAENGWSVRELEQVAAAQKADAQLPEAAKPEKKHAREIAPELAQLETRFRETFGVRATLTGTEKKGKIVLQYSSLEELERVNELLLQLSGENTEL